MSFAPTPVPALDRGTDGGDTLFSAPWFTDFEMRDALRAKRLAASRPRGFRMRTAGLVVLFGVLMTPIAALAGASAALLQTLH